MASRLAPLASPASAPADAFAPGDEIVVRRGGSEGLVAHSYKGRDYYLRRQLAGGDVGAILLALLLALALTDRRDLGKHLLFGVLSLPAWLVIFKCYGLYERDARRVAHTTIDDIPGLFHAMLLGSVLSWLYFQAAPGPKLTFITLLLFAGLVFALGFTFRAGIRLLGARLLEPERVLLLATGQATKMLIESMSGDARCHLQAVGRLTVQGEGTGEEGATVLGSLNIETLRKTLSQHRVQRVLLADGNLDRQLAIEVLHECRASAVKVSLLPSSFSGMGSAVEVEDIRGVTVFGVNPPVLSRSSRWAKRALDVGGSAVALALASPLLLLLALLVKLDSPGPAFFFQERIGKEGGRFRLVKLRTMVMDAEAQRASLLRDSKDPGWLHLEHDPRITGIGRLLRLTSLDELPQLWNVLRGHMSLVGPRPLIPEEDAMVDGWARGRLDLTPGLTGLWQVLGRTSITFEEMVKLDYLYVANWSLWGDLRLMLRTLPVLISGRGAN